MMKVEPRDIMTQYTSNIAPTQHNEGKHNGRKQNSDLNSRQENNKLPQITDLITNRKWSGFSGDLLECFFEW